MERTILTTLTADELRNLVADAVEQTIKGVSKNQAPAQQADAPFISKREAARLIGVCVSTIDNAARAGKLKRHYVGKSVRFDRTQVLALAK